MPNDNSPEKQTTRESRRKNSEPKKATRTNENPRKRRHSQPPQSAENKIFQAESAINTDKGTCPESLLYRARDRIRADNEFKTDIKRIRKNAEQEFVRALTRCHYREIDRARVELKQSKRPKVVQTSTENENCKSKPARSAPAACNTDVTITMLEKLLAVSRLVSPSSAK